MLLGAVNFVPAETNHRSSVAIDCSMTDAVVEAIFLKLKTIWDMPIEELRASYNAKLLTIQPLSEPNSYRCVNQDGGVAIVSLEDSL
jgi:hypothetical protein